jgi:arylsulfotransferase ASST
MENGTMALVTKYRPSPYNLREFDVKRSQVSIMDSIFRYINISSGEMVFEWSAARYVVPDNATTLPTHGQLDEISWDYFHINSVDRNEEGDYLVSARHTSALYKISRESGQILWTLRNGPGSDFELVGFSFWGQHHASWISVHFSLGFRIAECSLTSECQDNSTHSIISLLDNGNDEVTQKSKESSGIVIVIDHMKHTAKLLRRYLHPRSQSSISQGSFQILANRNVFIGWGSTRDMSEHLDDGTCVFNASTIDSGPSYRTLKSAWVGEPLTEPDLWTYAQKEGSQTVFYASWNGATEVSYWKFYASSTANDSSRSFVLAGMKRRDGFETVFTAPEFYRFTFAEAMAKNGTTIRNSTVVRTWTPDAHELVFCNAMKCAPEGSVRSLMLEFFPKRSPPVSTWTEQNAAMFVFGFSLCALLMWIFSNGRHGYGRDKVAYSFLGTSTT